MSSIWHPHHYINAGDRLKVTRPDGTIILIRIDSVGALSNGFTNTFTINSNIHNSDFVLNWFNCFSFGNGVESNRVRDGFNKPFITNGVRVSTVFEDYKEEHKKYGLIYSGLYNDTSGVNSLNQFIQAEKITKDINSVYGSIQKLHTRDTDLVTICEDKVLRILANKDAVYNADGNINLTATENVLGQTVPFVGEYGISKNPESFAVENYRSYFTDKQRGAVLRLSKDGLTPISDHGMRSWFKDNLKNTGRLIGSHDDLKDEYNLFIDSGGLNLLTNSNLNTGGSWQTSNTTIGNEVENSTVSGYVAGTTTISNVYGGLPPEHLLDGNVDDGDGIAAGQLNLLTVGATVTQPDQSGLMATIFDVVDMQPLWWYFYNNQDAKITHVNGILAAAGPPPYILPCSVGSIDAAGNTMTQNMQNMILGFWTPNQAGNFGISPSGISPIFLNPGDVLTIAVHV